MDGNSDNFSFSFSFWLCTTISIDYNYNAGEIFIVTACFSWVRKSLLGQFFFFWSTVTPKCGYMESCNIIEDRAPQNSIVVYIRTRIIRDIVVYEWELTILVKGALSHVVSTSVSQPVGVEPESRPILGDPACSQLVKNLRGAPLRRGRHPLSHQLGIMYIPRNKKHKLGEKSMYYKLPKSWVNVVWAVLQEL